MLMLATETSYQNAVYGAQVCPDLNFCFTQEAAICPDLGVVQLQRFPWDQAPEIHLRIDNGTAWDKLAPSFRDHDP